MELFKKETKILITDEGTRLHVCDLNGNLLKSVNPDYCLKAPIGICVGIRKNGIEEIYIYDRKERTVFVFNQDFELIKKIGMNLEKSDCLTIDCESDILYCSHFETHNVTFWNVNDSKLIQKLQIEQPLELKISENKLYIVSGTDFKFNWGKRKLPEVFKGNYINVLNKSNYEIINKIQFDDWFFPYSLHLSSDGDIYTIAYELDKNNRILSKNRFLFIISSTSYQIKQKIELNDVDSFNDSLYLNNQLILCRVNDKKNTIRIIEFE